jgi:hypothetical protein
VVFKRAEGGRESWGGGMKEKTRREEGERIEVLTLGKLRTHPIL